MRTFEGTVRLKKMNIGSKSEGIYAYLFCGDQNIYILCRQGVYPLDDSFFDEYDNQKVVVSGELADGEWLTVETIVIKKI